MKGQAAAEMRRDMVSELSLGKALDTAKRSGLISEGKLGLRTEETRLSALCIHAARGPFSGPASPTLLSSSSG